MNYMYVKKNPRPNAENKTLFDPFQDVQGGDVTVQYKTLLG